MASGQLYSITYDLAIPNEEGEVDIEYGWYHHGRYLRSDNDPEFAADPSAWVQTYAPPEEIDHRYPDEFSEAHREITEDPMVLGVWIFLFASGWREPPDYRDHDGSSRWVRDDGCVDYRTGAERRSHCILYPCLTDGQWAELVALFRSSVSR